MKRTGLLVLTALAATGLAACDNTKEQLGLAKRAPDEFAVIKRAPLEMPPDYYLRPPRPGAPRPQEQTPEIQARETVFGAEPTTDEGREMTQGEAILLQKTGAYQVQPNIRDIVDRETEILVEEKKPTIDRLLEITGKEYEAPASVVDAPAEVERLKKNKEEGKPVNEGETPTVEN